MTLQVINIGVVANDHTGDPLRTAFDKCNQNFAAGTTLSYLAVTVTAATTNDWNPGGTGRIDVNPSTNNIAFTGMLAGTDGQQVVLRNIGTTFTITLNEENAGSVAANRFTGQGDSAIPPGGQITLIYYALPNPRWSMG